MDKMDLQEKQQLIEQIIAEVKSEIRKELQNDIVKNDKHRIDKFSTVISFFIEQGEGYEKFNDKISVKTTVLHDFYNKHTGGNLGKKTFIKQMIGAGYPYKKLQTPSCRYWGFEIKNLQV